MRCLSPEPFFLLANHKRPTGNERLTTKTVSLGDRRRSFFFFVVVPQLKEEAAAPVRRPHFIMKAAAQQTSPAAAMVEQKTIQLPPARQRLKESRLSRLWFQFRILTGLWAAEPWEKVFFGLMVGTVLFLVLRVVYMAV